MTKISLEIETMTESNKKNTINISYVNPNAANDKLKQFAQKLVMLTTDTYFQTTKVTKESVI